MSPGSDGVPPAGLNDKLIDRMYRALLLSENPRRDRAILRLFLHHGCTVRDVVELEVGDVDLAAGRIRWRRSGRETADELPADLVIALKDYFHRERRGPSERFFTTRLGHPLPRAQVLRLFRFLQRESGRADLNPNTLREHHRRMLFAEAPARAWTALRKSRAAAAGVPRTDGRAAR